MKQPKLFGKRIISPASPGGRMDVSSVSDTETLYFSLDPALDQKLVNGLEGMLKSMVCAISNTDLLDADRNLISRHTVSQPYLRRLLYGFAAFDEEWRDVLDDAFKLGRDQFFGRYDARSTHLGAVPEGAKLKPYRKKIDLENEADRHGSVVDLAVHYVFDHRLCSTAPVRNRVENMAVRVRDQLAKRGLLVETRLLGPRQLHRFSSCDQVFTYLTAKMGSRNYSPQLTIHPDYLGEHEVGGALADLEWVVLAGIETVEDVDDSASRYAGALNYLASVTGKGYKDEWRVLRSVAEDCYKSEKDDDNSPVIGDVIDLMRKIDPDRADEMQKNYDALVKIAR